MFCSNVKFATFVVVQRFAALTDLSNDWESPQHKYRHLFNCTKSQSFLQSLNTFIWLVRLVEIAFKDGGKKMTN